MHRHFCITVSLYVTAMGFYGDRALGGMSLWTATVSPRVEMAGGRSQRSANRTSASTHASPAQAHSHASMPPLPPPLPPSPIVQLHDLANEPVRVYPFDRSARVNSSTSPATPLSTSAQLLQALQNTHKAAVVVGILASEASSSEGVYTFANRLIGRVAFMPNNVNDSALDCASKTLASIQLFYDDSRSILFLLGVTKPESDFLASLSEGDGAEERDLFEDVARFQAERRKMELVMHTCSHLLFHFNESGRFTANIVKIIRSLASEKQSLLAQISSSSGKPSKRSDKNSGSSSQATANVFAPGRCVPFVMFVVPARDEILTATNKQISTSLSSSLKSRSSAVAFCKAHEAMLYGLFRSLRGGLVGTLRTRDGVAPANLGKERRLFQVDPAHCVAVISTNAASLAGSVEKRFESVLESLSWDFLTSDDGEPLDLDAILEPLEEDDVGFPHAIQHLNRCVDLVQNASGGSTSNSSGGKDSNAVRMDLLTVAQWLKAFQSLIKAMHRAEVKKKQEQTETAERESTRQQFDLLDVRM